jgi:hypothetical protein
MCGLPSCPTSTKTTSEASASCGRRQWRVVEEPVHAVDRLPNELRCDPEWPLRLVKLGDSRLGRFKLAATASISTLIRSEAAIAELPLEGEPAGAFCPRSEFTEQHRPCRRRASR